MKNNYKAWIYVQMAFLFLIGTWQQAHAQNGVKIAATAGTADPSAMLDITSSNKGLLFPRVTLTGLTDNTTPVNNPATGLVVYNLGSVGVPATGIYFWNGTSWVLLSSGGLSGSGTANQVARWTASNALGNSVIADDGTNVGIGVTPGTYKLNVQGGSLNVGTLYGSSVMYGTLGSFDTRATNPFPEVYNMGVTSEFKGNGANGLSDGGSFNSVLSIRNWSAGTDFSGGGVSQLAFTQNGNMFLRYSQTAGQWGPWKKFTSESAAPTIYSYTGADQTYTVPAGVTSITVKMWGAGGGGGYFGGWTFGWSGGAGGYTQGTLAVTGGQVLTVIVGGGGVGAFQYNNTSTSSYGGGASACNPGGTDCRYGGQGGGRSAIRSGATELMTAGGGGGGGASRNASLASYGGAGGGTLGQDGSAEQVHWCKGIGGSQTVGGSGGACNSVGSAGTQFAGGRAGPSNQGYGGGGGGGWYGGGGGAYEESNSMAGGGGGSGYIGGAGVTNAYTIAGDRTQTPMKNDVNYANGIGMGGITYGTGAAGSGGNGRVVISVNQ